MENGLNWEQKALISELTQGMELAKQLRVHLNSTSSAEIRELLLQRILSSYEKALLILKWSGSVQQLQSLALITGVPESSVSCDGSPRSEDFDRGFMDSQDQNEVSKKRKVLPTWTDQVRVCSQNGLEGHIDDGYSWRKYGQKDILGAKYPRSYYRCTYRNTQNCWASKQVQRSDENPTIFEIIYRVRHTCNQTHHTAPAAALASPDKQELKQNNQHNNHQQQPSQNMLLNFRTSLRVNTEDLVSKEMAMAPHFTFPSTLVNDNILGSFSPRFISPATSETNCFSVPPCQMNSFGLVHNFQPSESDLTEVISAHTPTTNSPIMDLNFSIDPVDLDPIFPFNTPGYFD